MRFQKVFFPAPGPATSITIAFQEDFRIPANSVTERSLTSHGLQEFDLVIFQLGAANDADIASVSASLQADGFTEYYRAVSNFPPLAVMVKRMGSTPDTSCTFDTTSEQRLVARQVVLRGCHRTEFGQTGDTGGLAEATNTTPPGITTTVDGEFALLTAVLDDVDASFVSVSAGWDDGGAISTSWAFTDATLGWANKIIEASGAVTPPTLTFSLSDSIRSNLCSFKPHTG